MRLPAGDTYGTEIVAGNKVSITANPLEEEARRQRRLLVWRYGLLGGSLGLVLTLAAWIFEFFLHGAFPTPAGIIFIHRHNPLLFFVDAGPFLGALLFAVIGNIQAKLLEAKTVLEELVRERSMETTLERAKLNAILDTAADAVVTFNEEGELRVFNNAARRMFGYEPSDVIGRDIGVLVPMLVRDQRKAFLAAVTQRGLETGVPDSRELAGLREDATEFPLEIDISRFTVGDEVNYTAILRDISERRRQERLRSSLVELTEAVNQSQDMRSLYEAIYTSLGQLVYMAQFFIALRERGAEEFRVVFAREEGGADAASKNPPGRQSLIRLVASRREPVLIGRKDLDQLIREESLEDVDYPFASWLGVPLINRGELIGVMAIQSLEEPYGYSDRDVWIMNVVSSQVGNAISREQARESLRQSEKRYRLIVEEAGEIVYTTDMSGNLAYVNPQAVRLTGYTEKELLGKKAFELVEDSYRRHVINFYVRQVRRRMKEAVHEFPIMTKDGERRWIEQNSTLMEEDGQFVGVQSIVHDITERRMAEAALREREERFRSLSASSPIGIFQVDASGQCIYVNKRFEQITGRTLAQSLGSGWLETIHPSEREAFRAEWMFSRDESAIGARELRLQRATGEERWVNVRWTPTYDTDKKITGYVGTFEDSTARKKTERVNRVLYEISLAAQESEDLQEFYGRLHELLSQVIDTTNFYVAIYDEATGIIRFPYAREDGKKKPLDDRKIGKGLTAMVIRQGKTVLLDEKGIEDTYARGDAVLIGEPAKNWLGVPLIVDGKLIGAVIIQSYTDSSHYTQEDVRTMEFVSSQIAAAIRRKQAEQDTREYHRQLSEAHQRIKEELALAARIQQARLPKQAPPVRQFEFSWLFDSCEEVAGDMFNFVTLDEHRIGIYILDVSGHGVAAALLSMSLSRSLTASTDGSSVLIRPDGAAFRIASPSEVAEAMNDRFPMNLDTNQYFTLLYGILDTRDNSFRFSRGGHPAPILVSRAGEAEELDVVCGPAIGIVPGSKYEEFTLQLSPGDKLVMYTDGLDEANNASGEEFGVEGIKRSLMAHRNGRLSDSIQRLRQDASAFSEGVNQDDDITIVGLRMLAESQREG